MKNFKEFKNLLHQGEKKMTICSSISSNNDGKQFLKKSLNNFFASNKPNKEKNFNKNQKSNPA